MLDLQNWYKFQYPQNISLATADFHAAFLPLLSFLPYKINSASFDGSNNMIMSSTWNIFRITGHWRGALVFLLRLNRRLNKNNRDAGDLRRHSAHHDAIVI